MMKIPSLFVRNYAGDRQVRNEVVPGTEWVINGGGVATRKWDGTSCLVEGGHLFKRYDAKSPAKAPVGFIPAAEWDSINGHYLGWVPVTDDPSDKYHREAWAHFSGEDGTYELVGPKIQGGIEREPHHILRRHGVDVLEHWPRDFDGLRICLADGAFEGVVFHHPDGRMAKVKGKDFGIKRWNQMAPVSAGP